MILEPVRNQEFIGFALMTFFFVSEPFLLGSKTRLNVSKLGKDHRNLLFIIIISLSNMLNFRRLFTHRFLTMIVRRLNHFIYRDGYNRRHSSDNCVFQ